MTKISVRKAISIGTVWINLPVLPIMFAPVTLFVLFSGEALNKKASGSDLLLLLGMFVLGFGLSWACWSFMVPRWRLWAWARVDDAQDLRRRAVRAGLIWPEGHVFEKTEIRTATTKLRLRELESRRSTRA